MEFSLNQVFDRITPGEPVSRLNLTLVPLSVGEAEGAPSYLLLDEALASGLLEVGELHDAGTVNTILVRNRADRPVLILDGEELVGAKQNRMVNATVLIAAETEVKVPVSCVERGRWRYTSPRFQQAGVFGYSSLRAKKASQVACSLREMCGFDADQGAIWREIDRKQVRFSAHSETDALHDVYRDLRSEMERYVAGLAPQPGQAGVACFINGRFTCLDLFGGPATLGKVWVKLVTSYAMDALEHQQAAEGEAGDGKEAGEAATPALDPVLQVARQAECRTYPSVGLGTDVRLRGRGVLGAGLVEGGRLLHLSLFGQNGSEAADGRPGGMARPHVRRLVF